MPTRLSSDASHPLGSRNVTTSSRFDISYCTITCNGYPSRVGRLLYYIALRRYGTYIHIYILMYYTHRLRESFSIPKTSSHLLKAYRSVAARGGGGEPEGCNFRPVAREFETRRAPVTNFITTR